MFRRIFVLMPLLFLAACSVDTTGLTDVLQSGPHPRSAVTAPVVVSVYGDLQCPACKTAHELIDAPLLDVYGTDMRFEFRHMPLSSIHPFALPAAEAAECAADQGKFWDFVDNAYEKQDQLSALSLSQWGVELGLETDLYGRCRSSRIKRSAIQDSFDEARAKGVNGTPTYFVNGVQVPATFEALSTAIEDATTGMRERL